jgi:hypothetical protein
MTSDKHMSDGGQTNVQRKPDKGQTEIKQMVDGKVRWQNVGRRMLSTGRVMAKLQDDKAQDVGL